MKSQRKIIYRRNGIVTKRNRLKETGILERPEGIEQQITPFLETNIYLQQVLDMEEKDVNDAFDWYEKMTVKAAARIAYDRAQKNGLDNNQVQEEFLYLLQAVHSLGEKTVQDLVIRMGKDPINLLTDFDINKIGGVNVITPRKKVPLETLADSSIGSQLKSKIISATYIGRDTVMFEYAAK